MKKVLKWIGIVFAGLVILGMIINANKTPEEKAAEIAVRAQAEENRHAEKAAEIAVRAQAQEKRNAEKALEEEKNNADAAQRGFAKCAASSTIALVIKAFDGSQYARTLNLSAIEVTHPQEVSFDMASKTRMCSGIITMNNTKKVNASYGLEARGNGMYMVTVEITD